MKWFWISFFSFLLVLCLAVAIVEPTVIPAVLAFLGAVFTVVTWSIFLMVVEHEPAAGWPVQATIRATVERTRTAQAVFQGDESRATEWGSQHRGERLTAAAARYLDGPARPPAAAASPAFGSTVTQPALPPPRVWAPEEAFRLNTPTKLEWAPTPPLVAPSNGTYGRRRICACMARARGRARPTRSRRWPPAPCARARTWWCWTAAGSRIGAPSMAAPNRWTRDPRHFAQAVVRLCDLYQERDALLVQHGAPNIAALEQPPQRIVVVISQFGAFCATAQAEGVLDDVLYPLSLILREAGAAGVHVLIEDQVVDQRWPRGISANAEPITGYLPVNYGAAGGYYDAHKLAPYQFHFGGTVFGTWPMAAVLPAVLARVQRSATVVSGVRPAVRSDRSAPFAPEVDPSPAPIPNAPNGQPTTAPGEADLTNLQALVWEWRDANPGGSQAHMRRDLENAGVEIARGYAHELWHRYGKEL